MKNKKVLSTLCLTGLLVGSSCLASKKRTIRVAAKFLKSGVKPRCSLQNPQARTFFSHLNDSFWMELAKTPGYKANPDYFDELVSNAQKDIKGVYRVHGLFSAFLGGFLTGTAVSGSTVPTVFVGTVSAVTMGFTSYILQKASLSLLAREQILEHANNYDPNKCNLKEQQIVILNTISDSSLREFLKDELDSDSEESDDH